MIPGMNVKLNKSLLFQGPKTVLVVPRISRRKNKNTLIVNELAGQCEDSFEDVKAQILTYFTYKAVKTFLNQLYEMNPIQYLWFYDFVASNENDYGKSFIRNLGKEKHDLLKE
ncbi:chaperonin-like RbcX protein 2, chloroplastic [Primulina eburnea]|uniref:chaperonin-like RbcX protein 2, chloroplastic n=1 Tax=Primulina eburnea TaxID=1245227 RepID=UPI003C6CB2D0